jgi:hypothetical protein
MRRVSARSFVARWAWAAAAFSLALPRAQAAEPAPAPPARTAPDPSLDALDRAIGRFEALLARDDDPGHQADTRAVLDALKRRRDALRKDFDASKVTDLRAEVNLDYQRLAAWIASAPTPAQP